MDEALYLIGITFGFLFAITCTIIFGAVAWYLSRPKPWNASAITATYRTLEISMPADVFVVEFRTTQTATSIVHSADIVPMAKLSDGGALSKDFGDYQNGDATIEAPSVIPSVRCAFAPTVTNHR